MRAAICVVFLAALPYIGMAQPSINEPAPDFALRSSTGENQRLSEYRGDVVLLNFWTKSCGHCREQLTRLEALYQAHRDEGFAVLSVAVIDHPEHAQEIADSLKLNFPILYDDSKIVAQLYDPRTMPLTVLIDAHGHVREVYENFKRGDDLIYDDQLVALLTEK